MGNAPEQHERSELTKAEKAELQLEGWNLQAEILQQTPSLDELSLEQIEDILKRERLISKVSEHLSVLEGRVDDQGIKGTTAEDLEQSFTLLRTVLKEQHSYDDMVTIVDKFTALLEGDRPISVYIGEGSEGRFSTVDYEYSRKEQDRLEEPFDEFVRLAEEDIQLLSQPVYQHDIIALLELIYNETDLETARQEYNEEADARLAGEQRLDRIVNEVLMPEVQHIEEAQTAIDRWTPEVTTSDEAPLKVKQADLLLKKSLLTIEAVYTDQIEPLKDDLVDQKILERLQQNYEEARQEKQEAELEHYSDWQSQNNDQIDSDLENNRDAQQQAERSRDDAEQDISSTNEEIETGITEDDVSVEELTGLIRDRTTATEQLATSLYDIATIEVRDMIAYQKEVYGNEVVLTERHRINYENIEHRRGQISLLDRRAAAYDQRIGQLETILLTIGNVMGELEQEDVDINLEELHARVQQDLLDAHTMKRHISEERDNLQTEVDQLQQANSEIDILLLLAGLYKQRYETNADLNIQQQRLSHVDTRIAELAGVAEESDGLLTTYRTEIGVLENSLAELKPQRDQLNKELIDPDLEAQWGVKREQLATLNEQYSQDQGKLSFVRSQLAAGEQELSDLRQQQPGLQVRVQLLGESLSGHTSQIDQHLPRTRSFEQVDLPERFVDPRERVDQ